MSETINREDLYLFQTGKGKAGIPDIWMPLSEEDKDSQIYCLGSKCKISKCRRRFQLLESTRTPNEG